MRQKKYLNEKWTFSLLKDHSLAGVIEIGKKFPAVVPGTIHTDLINNRIIEDPYFSDNEKRMKWISQCDWIYETSFNYTKEELENVDLVFEGLDTVAEIFLNNKKLSRTENMFCEYRFDITKKIIEGKNDIKIKFLSPINYVLQQQKKYGELPVEHDPERIYLRKAQYSFGWDWGPVLTTSGIWRDVYLEKNHYTRISHVNFKTISLTKKAAAIEISIGFDQKKKNSLVAVCELFNEIDSYKKGFKVRGTSKKLKFIVKAPKLWMPNGEGEQNLYNLRVKLYNKKGNKLDEIEKKVGIRIVELRLKEKGKNTFKILINNKEIFCKGANWIPSDSFLPRVDRNKIIKLLQSAKDANMNMIRLWGGGVYENDEFYEECDKLGLMVWQDMMFACAPYPEHKKFIENVKVEISQNIRRLQHHPSIVLWCGNNENEWIWYRWQKESFNKMPGLKLFESVIPEIINEIDDSRPYWQSSPFGKDEDPNSENSGNRHQWNIWSRWIDYNEVHNDKSLFVTEFGFQGPANIKTFEKYLPESNRKINDEIFEFHNKQIEGPERIFRFLAAHLPLPTNWEEYFYLAQLNQGLAIKTCLEHWRTNNITKGSIIWQLNDSYPVTSWSLIDYKLEPKLSYYFVKDSFNEFLIFQKKENSKINYYLLNQNKKKFDAEIRINIIDGNTGLIISESSRKIKVKDKVIVKIISLSETTIPKEKGAIAVITMLDDNNDIISRNYFNTKRWKYIKLQKPEVKIEKEFENKISLSSDNTVFFVDLFHPKCSFDKRGFIILPGEEIVVTLVGTTGEIRKGEIKIISLNNFLSD